ncbi:MAG: mechanosensitive ion channel family protein [Planctomycetales bacterium]|nr:mechanosensitive ion channel family protein [Planctomycetales bacterium]
MNLLLLAQALPAKAPGALPNKPPIGSKDWMAWVLGKFSSLTWDEFGKDEWTYVATYYGLRALFVVVLMVLAWTVSSWASMLVRGGLRRVRFDETLTSFISKFVRWLILGLAVLTCLSYFGIETTSFAAVIGAAGLAIGLAFQGTLSNFAAGAMLLVFRPYKIGDIVNVAGNLGKVFEIELFTTAIDTFDNRRFIIPNSEIFGSVIENITYHPVRRVDIEVGASYDADIDQTRKALEDAIGTVAQCVANPEPAVVLTGLGASSVDWSVRIWVNRDDFGDAKQALIRAVKMQLDQAGIAIPYPQLDIHVDKPADSAA